jgi:hypothetical protein
MTTPQRPILRDLAPPPAVDAPASAPLEVAIEAEAPRVLTPAAQRALAEAEARRLAQTQEHAQAKESGGQAGPDPVRFGDWENKGIAWDF